jgi:catechol 2,3-dioxygenase-like lactoylglutathione lyase family enzyme
MVRTLGLTHIAIAVRDLDRAFRFYEQAFGVREVYRDAGQIQFNTPGSNDVFVLEHDPARAGEAGGISHFGFRLVAPDDIDAAVEEVVAAGATLVERGEFTAGEPYAFVTDPDGYSIEIWFEVQA